MTKLRCTFVTIIIFSSVYTQETSYFNTKRDYIYTALYIDSIGDTVSNESLTIRIPDKRWFTQPWKQKSVIYIYDTDTASYRKYIESPGKEKKSDIGFIKKNGDFRLRQKETTGGLESKRYSYFYMHPPRSNQYSRLFFAAHPYFFYSALEKETDTAIITNQLAPGKGYFRQEYIYEAIDEKEIVGEFINVYQVNVTSNLVKKKDVVLENLNFYSSTLNALFCLEYGFVKMHYEFKNGVRIEFDLVKVVDNS